MRMKKYSKDELKHFLETGTSSATGGHPRIKSKGMLLGDTL